MRFHFNSPLLKYRRKDLRIKSTETESMLWEKLRRKSLGIKFYRQFSIDGYVIDFYCPKKRLGIELEGGIHKRKSNKIYDKYREEYLKAFGIRLIKVTNEEVLDSVDEVVRKIIIELTP